MSCICKAISDCLWPPATTPSAPQMKNRKISVSMKVESVAHQINEMELRIPDASELSQDQIRRILRPENQVTSRPHSFGESCDG